MSEREGYETGVPCWSDHASGDPDAALAFYRALHGWEAADQMPADAPGRYFICRLRGRDVAGIGTQPEASAGATASWSTYVAVESADDATQRAVAAGGAIVSEPFDVFDAGRMAVLRDPAGAAFSVWEARRHRGAGRVDEPGALTWNELLTRDVEAATRFYGALFGWRALEQEVGATRYVTWHLPGDGAPEPSSAIAGLLPMDGDQWPPDLAPHWMTYFGAADADAAATRVEELGGAVAVAPFDTPAGRIAVVTDPVGAAFSLIALHPRD